MPKGVEHVGETVPVMHTISEFPLMPKGVEHVSATTGQSPESEFPLMPKGVEHRTS